VSVSDEDQREIDDREDVQRLFASLQAARPKLEELLERCSGHWGYEDPIYRYYHQSFKVYRLQGATEEIVTALRELAPDLPLNQNFLDIVQQGTGKTFKNEDNQHWAEVTRPILEAFFHARYFLEMVVRYGRELTAAPQCMPSGWAAALYLYNRR
jgi:hypothetical protein